MAHLDSQFEQPHSSISNGESCLHFERRLDGVELFFYLSSRGEGISDVFIRFGCQANRSFIVRERLSLVWAIMRLRHPLLASRVQMFDYDDVRFIYDLPKDPEVALSLADQNLQICSQSTHDLTDSLMNGARTLSDERLSQIIVNIPSTENVLSGSPEMVPFDIFFYSAHAAGDGMAMHLLANEFFSVLGSEKTTIELSLMLHSELKYQKTSMTSLPDHIENRLPPIGSNRFQRIARRVDYLRSQEKNIGGQVFHRDERSPRKTVVKQAVFDADRTQVIVKICKSQEVSVSSALSAACNFAWARTSSASPELPTFMRLVLNLRPHIANEAEANSSYYFLATNLLPVVLPTFVPPSPDLASIFWHRGREVKKQINANRTTPMFVSRRHEQAQELLRDAQMRARQKDGKPIDQDKAKVGNGRPIPKQLLCLSLLGNLDTILRPEGYPSIQLHNLFAGSRYISPILFIGFTFAGKLWLQLWYDENEFDKAMVERFWSNTLQVMDEYLL